MESQKVINGGGNKKNQGFDEYIDERSASVGAADKAKDGAGNNYCNTPDGQKVR